jgi:hypothetical protein
VWANVRASASGPLLIVAHHGRGECYPSGAAQAVLRGPSAYALGYKGRALDIPAGYGSRGSQKTESRRIGRLQEELLFDLQQTLLDDLQPPVCRCVHIRKIRLQAPELDLFAGGITLKGRRIAVCASRTASRSRPSTPARSPLVAGFRLSSAGMKSPTPVQPRHSSSAQQVGQGVPRACPQYTGGCAKAALTHL